MTAWICATCGNQHAETPQPPPGPCAICADERQWVPPDGQRWTSLPELAAAGHRSEVREVEPGLLGIGVDPPVAIGQRALLLHTRDGNLLWDPPGYLDDAAVAAVREAGGLAAVSASHPHFYGVAAEWSAAFGGAPILLPEADRRWLLRPSDAVRRWSGRHELAPGVTLVQCGGHFAGSAVVHWAEGAAGQGALLVGDTVMVTPGADRVTFLRSAPNRLPLPERGIRGILAALAPYAYDRIYGGWWEPVLSSGARQALQRGADRYVQWLRGEPLLD